jgi:hypothetical protein
LLDLLKLAGNGVNFIAEMISLTGLKAKSTFAVKNDRAPKSRLTQQYGKSFSQETNDLMRMLAN